MDKRPTPDIALWPEDLDGFAARLESVGSSEKEGADGVSLDAVVLTKAFLDTQRMTNDAAMARRLLVQATMFATLPSWTGRLVVALLDEALPLLDALAGASDCIGRLKAAHLDPGSSMDWKRERRYAVDLATRCEDPRRAHVIDAVAALAWPTGTAWRCIPEILMPLCAAAADIRWAPPAMSQSDKAEMLAAIQTVLEEDERLRALERIPPPMLWLAVGARFPSVADKHEGDDINHWQEVQDVSRRIVSKATGLAA